MKIVLATSCGRELQVRFRLASYLYITFELRKSQREDNFLKFVSTHATPQSDHKRYPACREGFCSHRIVFTDPCMAYHSKMELAVCPTCGNQLIEDPNDDPAYGGAVLYLCETAGAAHIPFGWEPVA